MRSLIFVLILFSSSFGLYFLGEDCPGNEYKNVKIFWIEYASFYINQQSNGTLTGIFPRIMKKSLKECCARLNYSFVKMDYQSTVKHEVQAVDAIQSSNNTIFILFPILAGVNDPSASTPFHFIPIKVSPGPMVLASMKSLEYDMDSWFFLQMWFNPVFFLILASSASAGVIFWLMEFRYTENKPHYPFCNFIREMGNSIWFSIVTMTTVGYGDIVPRHPLAKFYAVLWMLTGTVLTSLFTAHISSAMTTLNFDETQSLLGKKLGVIQGTRLFFENEINFGAMISEYKEDDLFMALKQGNISRILLPDFLEAMYYLTNSHREYFHESFRIVETIRHPFSFGISIATVHELSTNFMGCLRMWLKWSYIQDSNIDYSAIDDNFIKTHSLNVLSDQLLIRFTNYAIILSAVLLVVSMIGWIVRTMLQRRLAKPDSNNDINEMK